MAKAISDTRIEGGAVICRYCNAVLTFNMMDRPPEGPCPCRNDWKADFEARCARGQLGWGQHIDGRLRSWDLTEHNAKSFDNDPKVFPIFNCPTCGGNGCVGPDGEAVG